MMKTPWIVAFIVYFHTGVSLGLDVHFEDPMAGFFYREMEVSSSSSEYSRPSDYSSRRLSPHASTAAEPTTSIVLNSVSSSNASRIGGPGNLQAEDVLHSARFIVLKTAQPVLIRAEYGPFEQRQTVPTQYVVPDLSEGASPSFNASSKPGLITDFKPHGLDLSAHPVTTEIPRDKPVLRVLFHAGGRSGPYRSLTGAPRTICIRLFVSIGNETKSTCCSPDGRDGTCLGQVTLPSRWWPSLVFNGSDDENGSGKTKHPKIIASVSYSVEEARGNSCSGNSESRVSIIPVTQLDKIPLVQPRRGYRQLAQDEVLHMLIPQTPLYPNSRLYVPVFLDQPEDGRQIYVVKIRCHSRSGIKILGLEETSSEWSSRLELNPRKTIALVTVFRKRDAVTFLSEDEEPTNLTYNDLNDTEEDYGNSGPEELFNWLLSVDDRDFELWNAGKIAWTVEYQYADGFPGAAENGTEPSGETEEESEAEESTYPLMRAGKKLKAKLHVQKDDAQAVLAIAKHSELMNLAVLTGHQVSKPLKIFTVTEAGEIADVTLRSSCVSTDNSVLKVSASCTSVYVDGSETRGALNAQINVKYGNLMGTTVFTVWMPKLPLKVELSDTRLSQIKGWRVPSYKRDNNERNQGKRSLRRNDNVSPVLSSWYVEGAQSKDRSKRASSKMACSLRYQQSTVSIFATFLAEDLDSGRKDLYPSRGSQLDITELLVSNGVVRIVKSNVALLRNNVIQGLSPGKTEVHVLSPISGKEIGKADFRVAKNRESIVGMNVRILSGLKLSIHAEQSHQRRGKYSLQTAYSKVLSSKYQEGLVDVSLVFSDETLVPLSDIDSNQYHLSVKSLDPRTVAFAPLKGGKYPRIIAVGSGRGKLLRISFEPPSECSNSGSQPLSSKDAEVIIKIKGSKKKSYLPEKPHRAESGKPFFEDHATFVAHKKSVDMGDLGDMIQDEEVSQPYFESGRRYHGGDGYLHSHRSFSSSSHPRQYLDYTHLTPLEVGLYVLLAVFCATIAIFVASCFVYASRHRKVEYPTATTTRSLKSHQSVQNAHDWVWLGKAGSVDEKSVQSNASSQTPPRSEDLSRGQRGYRQRASYMGSEVNIIPNPRTEEFELSVSDPNTPLSPHNMPSYSNQSTAPAIPPHQNILNKKNTNPFLYDEEELEREYLMHKQAGFVQGEVYDTVEGVHGFSGRTFKHQEEVHEEEREDEDIIPQDDDSPVIDSSTYTKKSSSINPESMILPVGFPFFAQEDENLSSSASTTSWEEEEGAPPLRQSPASALPPLTDHDFIITPEDVIKPRGEYIPLNPDIEKPSPPRKGSLIQNPMGGTYIKKRPHVIGNPMFPKKESIPNPPDTEDEEEKIYNEESHESNEICGSEDVSMDYDQLMSYFESLKESTA